MGILEIIGLGYIVNIFVYILFMFLVTIETLAKMFLLDKVTMAKKVLDLEKARGSWLSTKEICKTKGINPYDSKNFHILFPYASALYVIPYIFQFLRLNLIETMTNDMIRTTSMLEDRIKEHKNEKL